MTKINFNTSVFFAVLLFFFIFCFYNFFYNNSNQNDETLSQPNSKLNEKQTLLEPPRTKFLLMSMVDAALAADAATMGVHWEYDQNTIALAVGNENPLFHTPTLSVFYDYEAGKHSPYGDEMQPLLAAFTTESPLTQPSLYSRYYTWAKSYKGRLNHVSKFLVENVDLKNPSTIEQWESCVKEDEQANGFAKVPFVVARFYKNDDIFGKLRMAVATLQKGELTQTASALALRVLLRVLEGYNTAAAVQWIVDNEEKSFPREEVSLAQSALDLANVGKKGQNDLNVAAGNLGLSCELPGSLIVALAISVMYNDDYESALKTNAFVGGDNCSRSIIIGALCSANSILKSSKSEWSLPAYFKEKGKYTEWGRKLVNANAALN